MVIAAFYYWIEISLRSMLLGEMRPWLVAPSPLREGGAEDSLHFGVRQIRVKSWPCCVSLVKPLNFSEPRFSTIKKKCSS